MCFLDRLHGFALTLGLFALAPVACGAGAVKTLHQFGDPDPSSGANPTGTLVLDQAGCLYGCTTGVAGRAVAYRIRTEGSGYEVLHRFDWRNGDAGPAETGLIEGSDGLLYGTTSYANAGGRDAVPNPPGWERV